MDQFLGRIHPKDDPDQKGKGEPGLCGQGQGQERRHAEDRNARRDQFYEDRIIPLTLFHKLKLKMMTRKLMKLSALLAMLVAALPLMAQKTTADQILGKWLNEDKDAHVEIYKESGKYFGKIVWLKEPIEESTGKPKLDDENSDPALQTRPIMGLI